MEIGQKVKVVRLRDPISAKLVNKIKENPVGTIEEFKMVDGQGVGVFVRFDESFITWFFEDELEPAQ
ncbi:DUF2862 domain-containing protein [Ancylothrix sp. C2]|uniref:cytochrome b6f subunit PetP n=1 Tax=Ancylothrix sp. D3o TaxID=2953691 RepID=UPI0021BAC74B|nr:DUF2862 domain-containing protein [Ancylothrix sp. D3o]MCT7948879.1 DUF2862 domain-containing protein [Ancylothrix sp. D3o]